MAMMDEAWVGKFREEIKGFAESIEAFDKGELSRGDYKGKSGGFGSYAQKDPKCHMLRLRMSGGRLTKDRLNFLTYAAAQGISTIKLTTCEAVQLHNLSAKQVPTLMEKAIDAEIFTRGGGGDNPRNIMMSPLSGIQKGEAFDVAPYAEAAGAYLLSIVRDIKMPRKLKIAFCNGADDCCHAAFRDMGFTARPDGTFNLSIAGGLGNNHRMGVPVIDGLEVSDVLYAIRAMIETFCQHGCYTNRAKARTRYMQEFLGADGLKAAYLENFEKLKAQGGLDLSVSAIANEKAGSGTISHPRAIAQKQAGLYAVAYHPLRSMLPAEKPAALYEVIKDMSGVECRVAPYGALYIINLTADEAKKVLAVTEDGAASEFECSVSCVGSTICQQGVRDSQGVLAVCQKAVKEANLPDGALPAIAICGCPSSCAAPQSAAIGFMGAVKQVDGKAVSAFKMFLGGTDALGKAKFGAETAVITEDDLPAFLVELGKAAAAKELRWGEYAAANSEEVSAIIAKYN